MQPSDFCHYIDLKGREQNAQVVSARENPGGEPILSLSVVNKASGKTEIIPELKHFSDPSKQDNNPLVPPVHLHCWKRLDEEHARPASDHPLHDYQHDHGTLDEFGKVVPRSRPQHEARVAEYVASIPEAARLVIESENAAINVARLASGALPGVIHEIPIGTQPHHPGNPATVCYDFECSVCGKPVKKLAHHHGGHEFEPQAVDGKWALHTCKTADIVAHKGKISAPKGEAHQGWCSSHAGKDCDCRTVTTVVSHPAEGVREAPPVEPEPDVIQELDKAGTPPEDTATQS